MTDEKRKSTTDETLRITAKIDRLLEKIAPQMREWAIQFLCDKYLGRQADA